jgi:metal-responsive CopG/Arc/MetJ family transcriptional regulator
MQEITEIGGHSVPPKENRDKFKFTSEPSLVKQFDNLAKKKGKNRSELIRVMMKRMIDEDNIVPEDVLEKLQKKNYVNPTAIRHDKIRNRYKELLEQGYNAKSAREKCMEEFCESEPNMRKVLYKKEGGAV